MLLATSPHHILVGLEYQLTAYIAQSSKDDEGTLEAVPYGNHFVVIL